MEETGLLNRESRKLNVTMEITLFIFTADEAKGNRQWDLQGPEGWLSSDCWETVSGHQTGYMMRIQHRIVVQAYSCYQYMKPVPAAANRTWANQPEGAADPWQRQSAGKDSFKKKKKCIYFIKVLHNSAASPFQYGVPVTKYDRRGFKPRPRQLLLTNTFAVLVDRTKIKQRLDYSALRGENGAWPLVPVDLSVSMVK